MGLQKCSRCELNYILDGRELCSVCREEVRGLHNTDDSILLCSVCGEVSALPGQDMCKACLREMRSIDTLSTDAEEEESPVETNELKPDPVSDLEEIEEVSGGDGDSKEEEIDGEVKAELEEELNLDDEATEDDFDIAAEFDPLEPNEEDGF